MRISPPLVAREVKARADLVAIAGLFTRLRRSGHQLLGLCPLHSERHPSFYVDPEKHLFKCFGCGVGGDVFKFVMKATGCDFRRALEFVAEFSGVASEDESRSDSRFRASVGGPKAPLCPAQPGILHSQVTQESRARILAALDAANQRLRAIQLRPLECAAERAALGEGHACEPQTERSHYLLENKS